MQKIMNYVISFILLVFHAFTLRVCGEEELTNIYDHYRVTTSDINDHLPVLRQLAKECSSVLEIGRRSRGSTWALLMGLSESELRNRSYLEIEIAAPGLEKLYLSKKLARENDISYRFIQGNDMNIDLEERADLLFIDSIHTYCHLTYELEKFSPKINKYIVMHDTSPPWGYANDTEYKGDYSEYPQSIDREKKGLSPAVDDFLTNNPGWVLSERRFNNHGLVILKRAEKLPMNKKPKINVFIHACTITHWQNVLGRQLSRIKASGLYDASDTIYLGVLGMGDLTPFKEAYPKLKILFQKPEMALYERPTLFCLHDLCRENPTDSLILYLHTKGVTRLGSSVTEWTKMMEYFLIDRWQDCAVALQDFDVCGVNWQLGPAPHFSGNFWWATSAYVSTLPHYIKEAYLDPEMWIGQNTPNYKCLHYSNVDHYHEAYPESKYVDKKKPAFFSTDSSVFSF